MGMCFSLPFCHINASFENEKLDLTYGYFGLAIPCSESFEPGLKTNLSTSISFSIYNYTKEYLPLGFYTLWLDLNYSNIYYPTIAYHAFMNVSKTNVEIIIEWENQTFNLPRKVNFNTRIIIFSFILTACIVFQIRKRKNKKYFI